MRLQKKMTIKRKITAKWGRSHKACLKTATPWRTLERT